MRAIVIALALAAAALSGCNKHYVHVSGYSAGGAAPAKGDPIAVAPLRPDAAIREKQFGGEIAEQLCRVGYSRIVPVNQARWLLRYKVDMEAMPTYTTQFKPGWPYSTSTTVAEPGESPKISLALSQATANEAAWEGEMMVDGELFDSYRAIILEPLLEHIGKQGAADVLLKKELLYKTQESTPCLR